MSNVMLVSVAADVKATRKTLEDNLRCYRRERMKCRYSMETEAVDKMVGFYSNAIDEIERIEKWLAWAMDDEMAGDAE